MSVALDITYLLSGAAFGATAGLSPGPLQALVISETLRHGRKEGVRVSFAPLLTDFPIILLSVWSLSRLVNFKAVMGGVSILGAVFLARLAYLNLKSGGGEGETTAAVPDSLKKAVITNFLNPHPYMFWVLVGAPTLLAAARQEALAAAAFVFGFYTVLVGIFALMACGVASSRQFLRGGIYRWVMNVLGGMLLVFAVMFLFKGLELLGIL